MELLKDRPEFKETIENNFFFKNEIADILDDIEAEVSFLPDKDDIITEIVEQIDKFSEDINIGKEKVGESIEDKQGLAIAIFEVINSYTGELEITNKSIITEEVINKLSEFVKINYGLSIKEAYLQSSSLL